MNEQTSGAPDASREYIPPGLHWALPLAWSAILCGLLIAPWTLSRPDPGDDLIRNTIRLSLLYYALAALLMTRLRLDEWNAERPRCQAARLAWSLAWLAYLIHVALAMHFAHHWSHADAVRHTQERSGFGEGIYVSHLFTLVWSLDVLWWWVRPQGHARRSPWFDRSLHLFMAFMVFCGTVVYEAGFIRYAGLALLLLMTVGWAQRKKQMVPLSHEAAQSAA